MFRTIVALCAALSLAACGPLVIKPESARKLIQEDSPVVGVVTHVDLGERMMIQKDYEAVAGVMLPVTRISASGFPHDLVGFFEISANGYYCGTTISRTIGSDGRTMRVCYTESEFKGHVPTFKVTEIIVPRVGNIQRIIEYTGRADSRLTFAYREYNETKDGVFIRPAYSQDFTFDLAQGSEIGVKGARVNVIEASNTGITYQVLKHFPK